jgi:hypothetical protein
VNVPHALADDMVAAIRERGIVVCPTLAGSSYSVVRFLRSPELLYEDPGLVANVSANVRRDLYFALRLLTFPGVARVLMRKDRPMERWEAWYQHSLANTAALYKAGVPLVFGTDTPFAFGNFHYSVLGEMRALREAGLPNLEILRMATSRAANVLGVGDKIGTIEPGKVADLVLVDGDPLANLGALESVTMVVKEGRVVYRFPESRALAVAGRFILVASRLQRRGVRPQLRGFVKPGAACGVHALGRVALVWSGATAGRLISDHL